ncbi:MAG TPA: STAS domain-containing protein [Gaiellaceae bacterium]|nr:STAS domain-containing protein [Gaiellaceae bacterium]
MGDLADFAVAVDRLDDCVVVRVEGELDMASASEFEGAMSRVASAPHVVIDLTSCTFLDSTGMRVITETIRRVPRVSVVATDPGVLRVLEITAVDTMVTVHASLGDAL